MASEADKYEAYVKAIKETYSDLKKQKSDENQDCPYNIKELNGKLTRLQELKNKLRPGETTVTCHHCGYPWNTRSLLKIVGCPCCNGKTQRVKEDARNE